MVNPYKLHHCATCEIDLQKKNLLKNARCPYCGRFVSKKGKKEIFREDLLKSNDVDIENPQIQMMLKMFRNWDQQDKQDDNC